MQQITPHLWFDTQAVEAAEWYTSIFPNSRITAKGQLQETPSGDCDIVSFELNGHPFMAISAGPIFKPNPSISFMVNFDPSRDPQAREHLDELWNHLSDGGMALMPLQEYEFSKYYGWVQDRYGISWQLILTNPEGEERPYIMPALLFIGDVLGKAEEATDFYMSVFPNSKRGQLARYPEGNEFTKAGAVMFTDFQLNGQWFVAMDSGYSHDFAFNEGISFLIPCDDQKEIDTLWEKLSHKPEAEQCGWCKDQYGLSWQVSPAVMDEMMTQGTRAQINAVTEAFMPMKKLDLKTLQEAYHNAK